MADTKNPKPLPEGYDPELEKAQRGYQKYEAENQAAQKKLDEEDRKAVETMRKVKEKVKSFIPFKKGGSVSSASKRADGCAQRGKTRGRMV